MGPKVVCVGVDGMSYRYIKSHLKHLPMFQRMFRMGCGGELVMEEPLGTCEAWMEFLSGAGASLRSKAAAHHKRLPMLWNYVTDAGMKIVAVDVPVPVEAGRVGGRLEPRPCPVLLQQDYPHPEDVLMRAEDCLRRAVHLARSETCDMLLVGLPPVDLFARGPRSEAETFLVAHKSSDSVLRRLLHDLEPEYSVVFSPFAVARGTKTKPGHPSGDNGLWIVNGPNVPHGLRADARLVDLLPTLLNLLNVRPSGKPCTDGESLYQKVRCEVQTARV